MICFECGSEEFNVVRVMRNKRLKDGVWIYDEGSDTRLVICKNCGGRYLTETQITDKIIYDNFKLYLKDIRTGEIKKIKE